MRLSYSSIVLLVCTCLLVSTISCRKDYLDRSPNDQISGANFWNNEDDVKLALAGVYSRLQSAQGGAATGGGFTGFYKPLLDAYSDNAFNQFSYISPVSLYQAGVVNSTNRVFAFYNAPYRGIAASNYFLDNIDKVTLSDEAKKKYKAEVRYLRAFFYFELAWQFGGVIIYKTAPKTVEEAKVKQSTREEVLNFVNEDLDFAIANLTEQPYSGHVVKGSAIAMKARVLLYQKKYQEAATAAKQVIDAGTFRISPKYTDLFITSGQKGNPEIIFSTMYLGPNNPHAAIEGGNTIYNWYQTLNPLKNLVDDYEATDGKPISSSPLYNPANPYVNRDPRLAKTILLPGVVLNNPNGSVFQPLTSLTGFGVRKYLDPLLLPSDYSRENLSDWAPVHIRFADVLLMYAEATNEVSGPDASVYAAINQVRQRPDINMPPVDEAIYNTKDQLREYIRHERRIEFALEGSRLYDLKRWEIAAQKLSGISDPSGTPMKFAEKNNVLPFPQEEIDRNPNLTQNAGY